MTAAINAMPEAVQLAAFKDEDFMNEMERYTVFAFLPRQSARLLL